MLECQMFGRRILLFDRVDRQQLAALGDVRTPSIADLFVAVVGNQNKMPPAEYAPGRYEGVTR